MSSRHIITSTLIVSIFASILSVYIFPCVPRFVSERLSFCEQSHQGTPSDSSQKNTPGETSKGSGQNIHKESQNNGEETRVVNQEAQENSLTPNQNSYSSAENRLESQKLDIQSLKERSYDSMHDQLDRDTFLDSSFLR